MKKLFKIVAVLGLAGFAVFWVLTTPKKHDVKAFAGLSGDPIKGALVFAASGCASCHSAKQGDPLILSGGRTFPSDFGTFFAPNISPDRDKGIGGWSLIQFANAVSFGTSPTGQHYYPAFPFSTYQNMELADIADLYSYIRTLPESNTQSKPHDVPFPFSIRRGLGLWKMAFMTQGFHLESKGLSEAELRGRYLVEAMGHCTECHTSRNALGGLRRDLWLAGAPNPDGKGKIPNITPHSQGIKEWAKIDIVTYLNSGFTPEYDSAGGAMAEVIENMKQLPPRDLEAIAAYLMKIKALPKP